MGIAGVQRMLVEVPNLLSKLLTLEVSPQKQLQSHVVSSTAYRKMKQDFCSLTPPPLR